MNTKEWEKKVLNMFEQGTHANEVNQLIRSLLSSYTKEIREKVEKGLRERLRKTGYTRNPPGSTNIDDHYKIHESDIVAVLQILESNE